MTPAVSIQDLSKTYPLFAGPADRLRQLLRPGGHAAAAGVQALKAVNLSIERGQIFGIVGKNGSGKSTLLRLLSGVVPPTTGQITCVGKVAALLELGAGFNPEFSGRDNVLITCALLGIDDATAQARLPDIEAFADVGAFFDRPVKTYSTGMYARVAFAALAVCEPDVLILDEILAVGDEAFQRKCLARLETLAAAGCTIILVTHNSQLVIEFCQAAALLAHGELVISGEPKAVVHEYYKSQGLSGTSVPAGQDGNTQLPGGGFAASPQATASGPRAHYDPALVAASTVAYGNADARIEHVQLLDDSDEQVNVLLRRGHYRLCYQVTVLAPAVNLEFGSLIKSAKGVELAGRALGPQTVAVALPELESVAAGTVFAVTVPFTANLLPGTYFANAGVRADLDGAPHYLHRLMDALMFRVLEEPDLGLRGTVDLSIADQPPSFVVLDSAPGSATP